MENNIPKINLNNITIIFDVKHINYKLFIINNLIHKFSKENLYIENDLLRYPLYDDMDNILSCIRESNRDYNSMKFISTLLYYICDYDKNSEYRTYKFRTFLHNLKSITVLNPVSNIDFFNTKDLLIIKYKENILDEFIIGKVLNNLRKDIPNFAYTFIINSCNRTSELYEKSIDEITTIVCPFKNIFLKDNYIESNNNNTSIIMEKVKGEPLSNFLETSTLQEFYDIILQTCLALSYAYDKYKFTHYDLHTNNILIDKRNYESTYKYKYNNQDVYLTTNILVSIIDFGRAYVEYEGIPLSTANENVGEYCSNNVNKPFILFDFILLIWDCRIKENYNNDFRDTINNFITDILRNFLEDDYLNDSIDNDSSFITINYTEKLSLITYDQIITILFNIMHNKLQYSSNSFYPYNHDIKNINLFLKRNIKFGDCMTFYDFYINSGYIINIENELISSEKPILSFIYKGKINIIDFDYLIHINKDIENLELFTKDFINFLIKLYNNYNIFFKQQDIQDNIIVNLKNIYIEQFFLFFLFSTDKIDFVGNFIQDAYFMIKYVSISISKVIDIFNNINNINNIQIIEEFKLKLKNIIKYINSIEFIPKK